MSVDEPHRFQWPGEVQRRATSTSELKAMPDEFVRSLKESSVRRLCVLTTLDPEVFAKFGGKPFLTLGADSPDMDCATVWAHHLELSSLDAVGQPSAARGGAQDGARPASQVDEEQPATPTAALLPGGAPRPPTGVCSRLLGALLGTMRGSRRTHKPSQAPPPEWAHEVQLEAFVVAVPDAAAPGGRGLIQPLLKRYQADACSAAVFGLPAVEAVISHKWRLFAHRMLLLNLAIYLVWLSTFLAFMTFFEAGDVKLTLRELVSDPRGRLCVIFELVSLLAMAPFLVTEVIIFLTYRWGWVSSWNVVDISTYILQITITCLHVGDFNTVGWGAALSAALPLLCGLQCIMLFIRLQFFSRCFRGTAFDFLSYLGGIMQEGWWYICVMLLLVSGFAGAFWVTFRDDKEQMQFSTPPLAALTMLNWAIGGASDNIEDLLQSAHPKVATIMCIIYQFVVSMIMMSLLIGVLGSGLAKSTTAERNKFHLCRAEMIDELEAVLPRFVLRGLKLPRYIHILRISADSVSRLERQYMWEAPREPSVHGGVDADDDDGDGGGDADGSEGARGADSGSLLDTLQDMSVHLSAAPEPPTAAAVAALEQRLVCVEGKLDEAVGKVDEVVRLLQRLLEQQRQ